MVHPTLVTELEPADARPRAPATTRRGTASWRWLRGWILPIAVAFAWEAGSRWGVLPRNWFPAPTTVARTLLELAQGGTLARHVAATLLRLAIGFIFGAGIGTLLGVLAGCSALVRSVIDPSLAALRSIPSLAWVPLFLLWLGIGETSKVCLIALGVFFPVYLNLASGLLAIDRRWLEVATVFRFSRRALVRRVLLPAALPAFITGLRSGLGLGWMFVVAAELMGASRGLGYVLIDGQTTSRPELVMAALICFAVLGQLSDRAIERLRARAQPWRAEETLEGARLG